MLRLPLHRVIAMNLAALYEKLRLLKRQRIHFGARHSAKLVEDDVNINEPPGVV